MFTYTISELAQKFSISTRTIRFYEEHGLITSTRDIGHSRIRLFQPADRNRLKLILRVKRLGMTLSEIKDLIQVYEASNKSPDQVKWNLGVLARCRDNLTRQRTDLEATLGLIAAYAETCQRQLDKRGLGESALRRVQRQS